MAATSPWIPGTSIAIATNTSEWDDGLNAARTNLDRTITHLSEKIDRDRDLVSIDDLLVLTRAMENLVGARMALND